jgi:putative DNA-invertase from lambdoid prophage Rac
VCARICIHCTRPWPVAPPSRSKVALISRSASNVVIFRRLDLWGRSLADLVLTRRELNELGVGVVSLAAARDQTTSTRRARAGLLAVFAEIEQEVLRERVRAGIDQARRERRLHGRPRTAALWSAKVLRLKAKWVSHSEIARRLGIGRPSVRRLLHAAE